MRREGQQVTENKDYIIGTSRHTFFDAGVREAHMHKYHQMVLADLQGEGAHWNSA